ncbi:MAG: hypothetical protein H7A01_14510 [Hahellaceae bacterium]|nr:hypothetical protein [Hahellaceae bacterium]MCP5210270.1 hypothetical protein [Hahellaceae bacterium]
MPLKLQLMLLSLVMLLVPIAGYEFISELERELRQNQQQILRHTATLAANQVLQKQSWQRLGPVAVTANEPIIYAHPVFGQPILDGYFDDWQAMQAPKQTAAHDSDITYLASYSTNAFYLYINVRDSDIYYLSPGKDDSAIADGILLSFQAADNSIIDVAFRAIAPGPITPTMTTRLATGKKTINTTSVENIEGVWQESSKGFALEVRFPASWAQHKLAISRLPTATPSVSVPHARVITRSGELNQILAPFASKSLRLQLTDAEGWILAEAGTTQNEQDDMTGVTPNWLTEALGTLLRWIILEQPTSAAVNDHSGKDNSAITQTVIRTQKAASGWFSADYTRDALSVVVQPLLNDQEVTGTIRVEQMTNVIASLSNQSILYLLGSSVLLFIGLSGLLIGYASLLSFRISGLRRQVSISMTPDGKIIGDFSASRSGDEIGELSRQFATLISAVKGYTEYLETFSQKLVHEIKTPVAIVSSSLDMLKQSPSATDSNTYIDRAQEGVSRISQITNALREATRLEKSIDNTETTIFSLSQLITDIFAAYQSIDSQHDLTLSISEKPCFINGSPELIAQMLDKLFDNARGHTPEGRQIRFILKRKKSSAMLCIENEGSELPQNSQDIFDSFVSHRKENQEAHMGLGLVIVRLIAGFHGGETNAENLPEQKGVRFWVKLPLTECQERVINGN